LMPAAVHRRPYRQALENRIEVRSDHLASRARSSSSLGRRRGSRCGY
jgi:hypothetical protein